MQSITIRLNGLEGVPLLTHNEQLAMPSNTFAKQMKAISGKRTKTEEDHAELAKLEFWGGLYLTDDSQAGIPSWNILRSIQDGARVNRLGKSIERGLVMTGPDVVAIKHDGPSSPQAMWEAECFDQRAVKVGQSKVTRTRPAFRNWMVETTAVLDTNIIDIDTFRMVVDNAGALSGIGDYRPRFGRYDGEVIV